MVIPQEWALQVPGEDLAVLKLLECPLPTQMTMDCDSGSSISALFSKQEPEGYEEILGKSMEIPSTAYLTILQRLIGEAQGQGYCSIRCHFPEITASLRYPLWVVRYWERLSSLIGSKEAWANCLAWLGDDEKKPMVMECISRLRWISPIAARFSFLIKDLCLLLSDEWLGDEHINFFVSCFEEVATKAALPILITNLTFPNYMLGRPQVRV